MCFILLWESLFKVERDPKDLNLLMNTRGISMENVWIATWGALPHSWYQSHCFKYKGINLLIYVIRGRPCEDIISYAELRWKSMKVIILFNIKRVAFYLDHLRGNVGWWWSLLNFDTLCSYELWKGSFRTTQELVVESFTLIYGVMFVKNEKHQNWDWDWFNIQSYLCFWATYWWMNDVYVG